MNKTFEEWVEMQSNYPQPLGSRETKIELIDGYKDYLNERNKIIKNPEEAHYLFYNYNSLCLEQYPHYYLHTIDFANKGNLSVQFARNIESTAYSFKKSKDRVDEAFGSGKKDVIIRTIEAYQATLNLPFKDKIVQTALDRYGPSILELLAYWQHELELLTLSSTDPDIETDPTTKFIKNEFEVEGWQNIFRTTDDYKLFVKQLGHFFRYEMNLIEYPEIKVKKKSKGRISRVLKAAHKELSEASLASDNDFFKLIRCINILDVCGDRICTNAEIYKALTK